MKMNLNNNMMKFKSKERENLRNAQQLARLYNELLIKFGGNV